MIFGSYSWNPDIYRMVASLKERYLESLPDPIRGRVQSYEPWMSLVEHNQNEDFIVSNSRFFREPGSSSRDLGGYYPLIRTSRNELTALRELLVSPEIPESDLGALRCRDSEFQICLDPEENRQFDEEVRSALGFLQTHSWDHFERIRSVIREIVPLKRSSGVLAVSGFPGRGLSSIRYWCGVFVGLPLIADPVCRFFQLLLNLAHEAGHQILMTLQASDDLVRNPSECCYSPIRKVHRPVIRSMHAVAAVSEMILLCESIYSKSAVSPEVRALARSELKRLSREMALGLRGLSACSLTRLGSVLCSTWLRQLRACA